MTDLDTLGRRHAERVRTAMAQEPTPRLELDSPVARKAISNVMVVVAVMATLVTPLLFMPAEVGHEPVTTLPASSLTPFREGASTSPVSSLSPVRGGAFVPAGPMTGHCAWCIAVVLEDGRALVLGGWTEDEGTIAEIYDPSTSTFTVAGRLTYSYAGNMGDAALLPDGRVLLVGVRSTDGGTAIAEIFDPATGASRALPREGQVGAEAVSLADGRVLVVGEDLIGDGMAPAVVFDPVTETFNEVGLMQRDRAAGVTATLLKDGRVLVVGDDREGAAEIFDPESGTFTLTGSLNVLREGFTATLLPDGTVLAVGGGDEAGAVSASAEIFDPETGTFTVTGSMATARFWHSAAPLPDGRVLVVGNGHDWTQDHAISEIYDPETRSFSPAPSTIRPRRASTAVALLDGVLVLGQYAGNGGTASQEDGYTAEFFRLNPPAGG